MTSTHAGRFLLVITILMLQLCIACGGDGDDTPDESSTSPTTPQQDTETTSSATTGVAPDGATPEPTAKPTKVRNTASPVAEETATPAGPTATFAPTPTIPPVATTAPPPPPATVTGSGTMISEPVTFPRGLAVITVNHSGVGRFRVRMQRPDGSFNREVVEGTGTVKGSTGIMIFDPGAYIFNVLAEGNWQVDVLWPTPETAPVSEAPFNASGTGNQAVYFVLVQTGTHTLTMTHDGAKTYSVRAYTSEGRDPWDKFSGQGPTSFTVEFTIRDKAFEFLLLNISADANWTIAID